MTSWLCTNLGINQRPCQHIEVTQGLGPPPPRCPSCGRNTRWEKLPGLTRMGGGPLPSAAELSRKQQMHRKQQVDSIIGGLKEPNMNAGLMGEIRHFIRTVSSNPKLGWVGRIQDLDRISGRLRFAYGLSINADYLVGKFSPRTTPELIEDLDVALKARWDVGGGLLGGKPDYQRYAESPSGLRDYARRAISLTEKIWRGIGSKNDKEKEMFLSFCYEHDKGYNRILEYLSRWEAGERPADYPVDVE